MGHDAKQVCAKNGSISSIIIHVHDMFKFMLHDVISVAEGEEKKERKTNTGKRDE